MLLQSDLNFLSLSFSVIGHIGFIISVDPTPSTQFAPISTDNPAKFVFFTRPPILSVASSITRFLIPASDSVFAAESPDENPTYVNLYETVMGGYG